MAGVTTLRSQLMETCIAGAEGAAVSWAMETQKTCKALTEIVLEAPIGFELGSSFLCLPLRCRLASLQAARSITFSRGKTGSHQLTDESQQASLASSLSKSNTDKLLGATCVRLDSRVSYLSQQ